jgi:CheY-like chemotaxis protein
VDDNATNIKILAAQLTLFGMNVTTARSAPEALALMERACTLQQPFEVALLDHDMPACNGAELGQLINANAELRATRLIMLTSSGQHNDSPRFAEIGFAGYLLKPVSQGDLLDCLLVVLGSSTSDWQSGTYPIITHHELASQRVRGSRARLLVAEDNPVNQKVALRALEKMGYQVDIVDNGREAVRAWATGRYDLILMDCQMPELDGYEATREIRRREAGRAHIPIIALTAHAMTTADRECKAAGMDCHVAKPFDREQLSACIERFIQSEPSIAGS